MDSNSLSDFNTVGLSGNDGVEKQPANTECKLRTDISVSDVIVGSKNNAFEYGPVASGQAWLNFRNPFGF